MGLLFDCVSSEALLWFHQRCRSAPIRLTPNNIFYEAWSQTSTRKQRLNVWPLFTIEVFIAHNWLIWKRMSPRSSTSGTDLTVHIMYLPFLYIQSTNCSWSHTSPPLELSCTIFSKSFLTSGKPSSVSWKSSQDKEKHWQSVSAFTVARCLPLVSMHVSVGHTEGTTKAWKMSE